MFNICKFAKKEKCIRNSQYLFSFYFQQIQLQKHKKSNFNIISEDFIKKQDNFPIVRENDNYFIIDENEYLIIRENNESDYAIILDESLAKNTLHKTSIKLGPSENHNSSLGIILKANKSFSKALIFEINNEGKYRIKELKNSAYNYLSKKKNKWLKNKAINKLNKYKVYNFSNEGYTNWYDFTKKIFQLKREIKNLYKNLKIILVMQV